MALPVGASAPPFTLAVDDARTTASLSDFLAEGAVVLLFFPLAFSSTCTREMCAVADDYGSWQSMGATVVGISVDSPYTNARFARECNAPFPILSDFNRTASRDYGVLRETFGVLEGVSERAAFVIDGGGTIRYVWVGENTGVFPPLDEIRAAAAALATPT